MRFIFDVFDFLVIFVGTITLSIFTPRTINTNKLVAGFEVFNNYATRNSDVLNPPVRETHGKGQLL